MTRMLQRSAATLLLLLAMMVTATPATAAKKKPWESFKYAPLGEIKLPDYERVELPNGMVVYLAEDHEFPLLELSATIRVGGIYDPVDKVGLADITGTVLRTGGTQTHSGDEIDEMVEAMGMRLETWIDTSQGGAYLSALSEDTEKGMALLGDILMHPIFAEDKLELAKKEQNAAISRRNDEPMSIVRREAAKVIYGPEHPLARQPEYDTINTIARDDLVSFHQRYFCPNSVYLVVIGDFNRETMLSLIDATFGGWTRSTTPLPPDPEIPTLPRTVNVIDKPDLTQSYIVLGHIGIRADSPYYAPIQVANKILGGGFASRLFTVVRSNLGYAYSVHSMPGTGYRFPGVFMATCGTKSATTQAATSVILEQITRMTTEPVTAAELAVAKDGILNSEVFNFDTKREILDRLVLYEMNGYPEDFLQKYMQAVKTMTADQVLAAAQAVWHPDQLSILALGNRADWDGDMSKFGPVNDIDITIPEPTTTMDIPPATPESLQKGKSILAQVADKVAGKKLATLKGYHQKIKLAAEVSGMGTMQIGIDETVALPDREHVVQTLPFGEMIIVLDGDHGWMQGPMGNRDMSADQIADAKNEIATDLVVLLSHLDQLQCQALAPVDLDGRKCDQVYVTGAGNEYVLLVIDQATHLPAMMQMPGKSPMTQTPVTKQLVLEDYKAIAGFQMATRFTIKHDGELFATGSVEEFAPNPVIDEALFQK